MSQPPMKPALIYPFLAISAVGFILATIEHLAAITGDSFLSPGLRTLVYVGIAIVGIPVAFATKSLVGKTKKHDWRFQLRATPQWMRYTVFVLIVYAVVNMLMFTDLLPATSTFTDKTPQRHEDPNAPGPRRSHTSHAMAFYGLAFAILYSALHVREYDRNRRCGNGHLIPPTEDECKLCGAPLMPPVSRPGRFQ
jgi:hypothetical protein